MGSLRQNKQYHVAAALAAKLWVNQTNGAVNVVITAVYAGKEPPKELTEYAAKVEGDKVKVIFESAGEMKCAQKSQLVRMYLFEKDFVKDEDIIVTADADAFVIGDKLVQILREPHAVWIAE